MKEQLIHGELSGKIRGILYAVHNELGHYRNEQQYSDLIEQKLRIAHIPFEREKNLNKSFEEEMNGRNRVDFLIDNKIILEIKVAPNFSPKIYQ